MSFIRFSIKLQSKTYLKAKLTGTTVAVGSNESPKIGKTAKDKNEDGNLYSESAKEYYEEYNPNPEKENYKTDDLYTDSTRAVRTIIDK